MNSSVSLNSLGWRPFFQSQLDKQASGNAARVMHVHRGRVEVHGERGRNTVDLSTHSAGLGLTVGDWVVLSDNGDKILRRLQRFGVFQRRAAGTGAEVQTIVANVDTLFIVTSANRDFNVARLERYLAIAHDAAAFPVVVITKTDLADGEEDTPADYVRRASRLAPGLLVEAMDARDAEQVDPLRTWCGEGQTVALLGSSGVGKSTIVNTLTAARQPTYVVRDDDQRGRHTTTSRSMHQLAQGGWLVDTPGMRELQLVDIGSALDDVFQDVAEAAAQCRFSDCEHQSEPGCAVQQAISDGALDAERLVRYQKLQAEDRRNSESVAERRSRDKNFGKLIKSTLAEKSQSKGGH